MIVYITLLTHHNLLEKYRILWKYSIFDLGSDLDGCLWNCVWCVRDYTFRPWTGVYCFSVLLLSLWDMGAEQMSSFLWLGCPVCSVSLSPTSCEPPFHCPPPVSRHWIWLYWSHWWQTVNYVASLSALFRMAHSSPSCRRDLKYWWTTSNGCRLIY